MILLLFYPIAGQINNKIKNTASVNAVGYNKFIATWYCLNGKTAMGTKTSHGIIAVDPRVIKLGSKVDLLGIGTMTAMDTGGSIKGNRIDIWTNSCSKAIKNGRKTVYLKKL